MEQLNLRVKNNKLTVCVNDEGDLITLNLDDNRFVSKFMEFVNLGKERPFNDDDSYKTAYKKLSEYSKKLYLMIDELFGNGATYKIFEAYEPTADLIFDFIAQLQPCIKKASEMKIKAIEKQQNKFEDRAKKRERKR